MWGKFLAVVSILAFSVSCSSTTANCPRCDKVVDISEAVCSRCGNKGTAHYFDKKSLMWQCSKCNTMYNRICPNCGFND